MREDPLATECRILGGTDHWVCPGCGFRLGNIGPGKHLCPSCGRQIDCAIESDPTCVTRLADPREFKRRLQ